MDPVWYPEKKHTFKLRLPPRSKLPVLKVKVYDSDAPAIIGKVASASKTGDFLGEVTLKGLNLLHPDGEEFLEDLTPAGLPEDKKILGKVYKLMPDAEKKEKYNKLVQGTISISIDRAKVDEQVRECEERMAQGANSARSEAMKRCIYALARR